MVKTRRIEEASEKDLQQLLSIWQELSLTLPTHHFAPFGHAVADKVCEQVLATLEACLKRDDITIFILTDSEDLIQATLSVVLNSQDMYEHPESAVLFNLWVRQPCRRKGLGHLLVKHAKGWLSKHSVKSVQAGWHPENVVADAFWKAQGFSSYETIGACVLETGKG